LWVIVRVTVPVSPGRNVNTTKTAAAVVGYESVYIALSAWAFEVTEVVAMRRKVKALVPLDEGAGVAAEPWGPVIVNGRVTDAPVGSKISTSW
jgi:hypothetical protein